MKHEMADPQTDPELHPLADIDQVIHASARLMVLTYLYVVESVDFVFLKNMTGLTWGNLSTHLAKLEEAGYVVMEKKFLLKKPHTILSLTKEGRSAYEEYRKKMKEFFK